MPARTSLRLAAAAAMAITALPGLSCKSVYYGTMEKMGWEKRHLLVDRVEESRESQAEAQEQFQSAYDRFKEMTGYDGGDLERVYRKLNNELERSEKKAERVRNKVDAVDSVARDLFKEWDAEIDQISNPDLRRKSSDSLDRTRERFRQMINAMRRAESKMDPVLQAFRDQVLFLKHNLNAEAIASLEGTVASIETDVEDLIRELNNAIQEADSFLATMES
jgi:gas vesicle protein